MTQTIEATFTKLHNGDWGVRVSHATEAGAVIDVAKRNGSHQDVVIDRVIWTDGQATIASIRRQTSSYDRRDTYGRRTGCSCGSVEGMTKTTDCWTCRHDAE